MFSCCFRTSGGPRLRTARPTSSAPRGGCPVRALRRLWPFGRRGRKSTAEDVGRRLADTRSHLPPVVQLCPAAQQSQRGRRDKVSTEPSPGAGTQDCLERPLTSPRPQFLYLLHFTDPEPVPVTVDASAPDRETDPYSDGDLCLDPSPDPAVAPATAPATDAAPLLIPALDPDPAPAPDPEPDHDPAPDPDPESDQDSAPDPIPPSDLDPGFASAPDPAPDPAPASVLIPSLAPDPAPSPAPDSDPDHAPVYDTDPDPATAPAPYADPSPSPPLPLLLPLPLPLPLLLLSSQRAPRSP
ncbi:protein TsetseEP-like [Canis lupus dingo]|uniref:protein TsetseEP-like n=1 Tax=Canis lupus dingo TaxID=286419 RepID=UPI0015F1A055|nr:protein TsetseEP-like [Canis lupus dingo]